MRTKKVIWHDSPVNIPGIGRDAYDTETAFQIYCADWLRKRYQLTGDERFAWWHHSANERSSGRDGFIAKMMGQSKGFPDFVHFDLRMALELKLPGRKASPEQVRWLNYFRRIGWKSEIIFSFSEFSACIQARLRSA